MKQSNSLIVQYNARLLTVLALSFAILTTPLAQMSAATRQSLEVRGQRSEKGISPIATEGAKSAASDVFAKPLAEAKPAVPEAVPAPAPLPMAPPPVGSVTSSLTASLLTANGGVDVDNDGKADPGDTIAYVLSVANTSGAAATGLAIANPLDSHTTLVGGSLNSTPVAFDQSVSLNEDATLVITLQGQDPDGSNLTFKQANVAHTVFTNFPSNPTTIATAHGTIGNFGSVTCDANGICSQQVTYTPAANYNGPDSFTFVSNDGTAISNENGTINITVNSVNDAPTFTVPASNPGAVNEDAGATTVTNYITGIRPAQSGNTTEDTQIVDFVVSNVTHSALFTAGGQPTLTISNGGNPPYGAGGLNATLTYTPAPNANGTSVVTYHLHDNGGTAFSGVNISPDQTFTITVTALNDAPVAVNTTATVQANMKITGLAVPLTTGGGVTDPDVTNSNNDSLSADRTFFTGTPPVFTVTSGSIVPGSVGGSTACAATGTVSNVSTSAGTFDYDPPPGFSGTCTLIYTITDNGNPGTATSAAAKITLTINGPVIWFVDPTRATDGNGTLSNTSAAVGAFNKLSSANAKLATLATNQKVFVYTGSTLIGATEVLDLKAANDWLVGQGTLGSGPTPFDTFFGITPPSGTIARPTLSTTATGANAARPTVRGTVTMRDNTQVTGLNIDVSGAAAGSKGISGIFTSGTSLIKDVSVTSAAGNAVDLSGTQTITYETSDNTNSPNVITSSTGGAVLVSSSTIGANGFKFKSVSTGTGASGPTRGIFLNGTGAGPFTITGDGSTANSGGLIQHTGGTPGTQVQGGTGAIDIQGGSGTYSFSFMKVLAPGGDGIFVYNSPSNISIVKSTVDHNNAVIGNAIGLRYQNSSGTGTLTLDGVLFQNKQDGTTAAWVSSWGTSIINFNVQDSNTGDAFDSKYTNLFGSGIVIGAGDDAGSTSKIVFNCSNTKFVNAPSNGVNDLEMTSQQNATLVPNVNNNTFDKVGLPLFSAGVINVNTQQSGRIGDASNNALFTNNTITNIQSGPGPTFAYTAGGTNGYLGIRMGIDGNAGVNDKIKILNNTIHTLARQGILVSARGSRNDVNVLISGNSVGTAADPVATSNRRGIELEIQTAAVMKVQVLNNISIASAGTSNSNSSLSMRSGANGAGDTGTLSATVSGNTISNSNAANTGGRFRAETISATSATLCLDLSNNTLDSAAKEFNLVQNGGAIAFHNNGGNTGTVTNSGAVTVSSTAGTCTLPTLSMFKPEGSQQLQQYSALLNGPTGTLGESPQNAASSSLALLANANSSSDVLAYARSATAPGASVATITEVNETRADSAAQIVDATLTAEAKVGAVDSSRSPDASPRNSLSSFVSAITSLIEPTAHAEETRTTERTSQPAEVSRLSESAAHVRSAGTAIDHSFAVKAATSDVQLNHARTNSRSAAGNSIPAWAVPLMPTPVGQFPINGTGAGQGFQLPDGKTITITFKATLNNPPNLSGPSNPKVTAQATLTGAFTGNPLLSDDPSVGGTTDPTSTNVDLFDTTTTLGAVPAAGSWNIGQAVTFTATVAPNPANATPITGNIVFKDNGTAIAACGGASGVTISSSQAQCVVTFGSGAHSVQAFYSGDGNYECCQAFNASNTLSQGAVNQSATTTAVQTSGSPSLVSQSVTFTATVTSNTGFTGPPTGNVDFYDGSVSPANLISGCGAQALNGSGVATCTTSALNNAGSPHTITAHYNGDANFLASQGTVSQTVDKSNTNTALVASPGTTVAPGVEVTYTATVTSLTAVIGPPNGTVTFKDGASTIVCTGGSQTLNGSGVATCKFTYPDTVGSPHDITAVYNGDDSGGRYIGSTSNHVSETVTACSNPYTVTSNADTNTVGTLRYGITTGVCDGGVINFDNSVVSPITLTGTALTVSKNVTINGPGASSLTITGNNASQVFLISPTFTVTITGLTITGGKTTGTNGSTADPAAGGSGNDALGGAIYNNGTLTLSNVIVSSSNATGGDGATGTTTGGNGGNGLGGAIYNASILTVTSSTINGGTATGGKGGDSAGTNGNGGNGEGGGIFNAGTLTLVDSTVAGNSVIRGAAGAGAGTAGLGGAGRGGGIAQEATASSATTTIWRSTISGNSSATNGGGIFNLGTNPSVATLTIGNSTISGNHASNSGGGIFNNVGTGTTTIQNSTVTNNTADFINAGPGVGGGLRINAGTVILQSTIVAKNFKGTTTPADDDINGAVDATSSFNLVGVDTGMTGITDGTLNNQVGTAGTPIDPLLGALGNNGGPTQTHALLDSSPALDKGSNFSVTKLNGAIDNVVTSVVVADASSIPSSGVTIRIETEQMLVTGKTGNTLTVTRGVNSTTAASHADTTDVFLLVDQRVFVRPIDFIAGPGPGDESDIGSFERQVPSPTISKSFTPDTIQSGGTSLVTLTLTNPNAFDLHNASFTDTLVNMSASGGPAAGSCTGASSNSFAAGQTALSFSGITIPASSFCTVTFNVTSSTPGVHPNTTSGVATTETPSTGNPSAAANLTVAGAPTIAKAFNPTSITPGGTSQVTLTLANTNAFPLTAATFSDTLVGMSALGGNVTGTCGASPSTLSSGDTSLTFTGITIPASGSCTVIFDVTSNTQGVHPNTTSGVSSAETPSAGPVSNTANLTVGANTIVKAFSPQTIQSGGTSQVTLTLSSSSATPQTNAFFTDNLVNMSAVGGAATGSCSGASSNTFAANQTTLNFTGIGIPANSVPCTVIFNVKSSSPGVNPNSTTGITTDQTPIGGGSAPVDLTVLAAPTISKSFAPDKIQTGGSSTVTITISNSNATQLTGGAFTDNLVNMSAVGGAVTGTCAATPNSLSANQTALSFSGITIPASDSCTVIFDVKSSTPGTNPNSTSGVTTNETPVAGAASAPANLLVFDPPLVQSIVRADVNPTSAASVNFTVTFTKAVSGVDTVGPFPDFTLTTNGVSGAAITAVSGGPTIYTVTVGTGTGDGNIKLNVIDDDSIVSTDALPLPLGGAGAGNGTFTTGQVYTVDRSDPSVTSITRAGSNPTNASTVDFSVKFSEPVSGVDAGDFALTTTGVAGTSIGPVNGSGTDWTVTVNTGSNDGTIRLDLIDNDTIIDGVGKPLGGVGAGNGSFTTGEIYDIDKTAPVATIDQAVGQTDPVTGQTATTVINFKVTLSESLTTPAATGSFTNSDISVSGTAGATLANITGSGNTYNVAVTGMTQSGTVIININAGVFQDDAGNLNSASTIVDNTVTFNADNFTTFEVNSTADPGDGTCDPIGTGDGCTLREAINAANADAGAETITFNSTVFAAPGPYTINLTGALPDITSDMTISGPGAKVLTVKRNTGGNYRIFTVSAGGVNLTIDGLTINNGNVVGLDGGGILYNGTGTVTITNSAISGNSTDGSGGGIAASGTLNITNSTISGNTALQGGGAVLGGTSANISNSTISGNTATGNGGGIFTNFAGLTATITDSTITSNRADNDTNGTGTGGGVFRNGGTVILRGNIVAANYNDASPSTTPDDIGGTMDASSSFNLIGTGGSGGLVDVSSDAVHQNQVGVASPGLNPLADNGGPTMTHSLQCTSPAIDKGKAFGLTTDQRGGTRPFDFADSVYPNAAGGDGSDIGAYESQAAGGCLPTAVPPSSPTTTNEDTPVVITLTGTYSQNTPLAFSITQNPTIGGLGAISAPNCTFTLSQTCTATVTYTPNPNANGSDLFKFKVSAGPGIDSDPADVPVTVTAVNDPPTFLQSGNQTVLANSGPQSVPNFITTFAPGPADESGQTVQFNVTGNTNPGLFSAAPAVDTSGTLTYTPATNTNGVATITIVAQDNGGGSDTSAPQNFNITVNRSGTTTNLASSINPSFTNQLVTFTATVTSNTAIVGPPTGTVSFFDGVTPLTCSGGNQTLDGAGKATCDISTLTAGGSPHSINATYNGDGAYLSSNSNTVSQVVKAPLTLIVNDVGDTPDASLDGICADSNGKCTLRAAIQEANFAASDDTINFNLPANSTINLLTALPAIDGNVVINGPGANTLTVQRSTAGGTPDFSVFTINSGKVVTISGLTIANGKSASGGGVSNNGTLTINNSTISGNSSSGTGGGIRSFGVFAPVTLTINNSTISGNFASAAGAGAGIHNGCNTCTATLTINNSTISGNSAGTGVGIYNQPNNGTAAVTIINSTISGNIPTNAGNVGVGGILSDTSIGIATLKLSNTIVAGNTTGGMSDITGPVDASSSFNLIGVNTGITGISNGSNGNQIGTAASPINPRLAPLAFNGGTTQTMALLSGSPALDAGSNTIATNAGLTTDQRGAGFNRFIDGVDADAIAQVDIGAFEAQVSIEDITDKSTNEDTALPSFNFKVADGGVSNFTVTATSSNTTLVPNGNLNVGGAGSTRSLSITPAANQNGTTTITVTVAGTIGTTPVSMTDTFVLTVNAVNDAPTFALAAGPIVNEDSGPQTIASQAVNISAGPADESGQTVAFTVSNNNNGLFSVQPAISPNGTLTFTSAPDANGSATVSVTLKDNGGTANGGIDTSVTQQFTITVNAVNDAPVNTVPVTTQQVTENSPLTFSPANANAISIADVDAGGGAMRETLTATNGTITLGSTAGLAFTVGNGTANSTMTFTGTIAAVNTALQGMTFNPTNGFSGAATLTIVTNDQGNTGSGGALSDTDAVNINVNDGGTLQLSAATYTVGENSGPAVITITRTGGTAGTATVKIDTSNGTATAGSDYTAVSQTVTFNNGETSKTVNVAITDDLLNEPDETVNITLSNAGGSGALGTPATAVLTITNDDPVGGYIKFSTANYNVSEGGVATITVQRTGTLTQAVTIDFATTDNSDPASFVPCAPTPGNTLATSRCDFETALGRISFAAGDGADKTFTVLTQQDNFVEGPETLTLTLSNPTGGAGILGLPTATLTINDDLSEPAANPVDDTANFVESLYRDFLNRPSDPGGKAFWIANIDKCNSAATRPPNLTQAECIAAFRVSTAQAFFLSGEYQQTGGTAYLTNKVAFGSLPNFIRFEKDAQMLGKGYVFGAPGADAVLEANKVAYFDDYVSRTEFVNTYGGVSNQQYVETLTQNTGVIWGVGEKQQLVDGLNNATETRATVLRKITEKPDFRNAERESMFVLTEYFGFLRRNPDQPGFNFWLNKLHSANGNAMQAEMVRAFVESPEYRQRFGQ